MLSVHVDGIWVGSCGVGVSFRVRANHLLEPDLRVSAEKNEQLIFKAMDPKDLVTRVKYPSAPSSLSFLGTSPEHLVDVQNIGFGLSSNKQLVRDVTLGHHAVAALLPSTSG